MFLRVYERLDSLRSDDAIRPWVGQLTRNCCLDLLRASSRLVPVEEVDAIGAQLPDDVMSRLDEAMVVREGLSHLGPECQEILDRFFARDESYRTIGDALAIPPGTIASRISRCLGHLRTSWKRRSRDGRNPRAPPSCTHGDRMTAYDEERLGELLRPPPPAPAGWIEAAQARPPRGRDRCARRTRGAGRRAPAGTRRGSRGRTPQPPGSSRGPRLSITCADASWRDGRSEPEVGRAAPGLDEFLDALEAPAPSPCGGSAAAVAAAMAASLVTMVARSSPGWADAPGIATQARALRSA